MPTKRQAAHRLLAAHDAREATRHHLDPTTGALGWRDWYHGVYNPAYRAWDEAMREFAELAGDPKMSRQPEDFRELCRQVLHETNPHRR